MDVYKFKSIASLDDEALTHTLDIIQNNRVYCGTYDQMNDPFEGILGKQSKTQLELERGNHKVCVGSLSKISDEWKLIKQDLSKQRFCSLTTAVDEVLMWSHYAGNASGLAIKLDIPRSELTEVRYVKSLEEIPQGEESQRDQLCYKLSNWRYESEFRLFNNQEFYSVTAPISEVIVSPLMNLEIFNCIKDACWAMDIDVIPARFEQKSGKIRT